MSKIHTLFKRLFSKNSTLKIHLDEDLVFYSINFKELTTNFVFEVEDLYDERVNGIPAFLIFQNPSTSDYENYTYFEPQRLKEKQPYALLYYDCTGSFGTRAVSAVSNLELRKIVIKKYRIDKRI